MKFTVAAQRGLHFKKSVLAVGFALSIFSCESFAQIPVTDVASIANNTLAQVQNFAQTVQQVQNSYAQIVNQVSQINALTKARNLGELLNSGVVRQALPADFNRAFDTIRQTGILSGTVNAQKLLSAAGGAKCSADNSLCQAVAMSTPNNIDFLNQISQRYKDRAAQLDGLRDAVNYTQDQKSSSDLAARIGAEQAALAQETAMTLTAYYQMKEQQALNEQAVRTGFQTKQDGVDFKNVWGYK